MENIQAISENEFVVTNNVGATIADAAGVAPARHVIATDCDEVLVNITDKWIMKCLAHRELRDYFSDGHLKFTQKNALLRDTYYVHDWLGVEDPAHRDLIQSLYFDDELFYDDLRPASYLQSLLRCTDVVSDIHVITSCGPTDSNPATSSKRRFLEQHLVNAVPTSTKVHLHFLPTHVKKGAYMAAQGIRFSSYADDLPSHLAEVAQTALTRNFELMMPGCGYNILADRELVQICNERNARFVVFGNSPAQTQWLESLAT